MINKLVFPAFIIAAGFSILMSGCAKEETSSTNNETSIYSDADKITGNLTSVYDSTSKMYIAPNFNDEAFTWVDSVKNLPTVQSKRLRLKSLPMGRILESREVYCGSDPTYAGIESEVDVPDGYVCTGLGARINKRGDVRTLTLEYRYINDDGTLGPRYRVMNSGLSDEQQYTPSETWDCVPAGAVVVGMGFGANGTNMATQWTYYSYLDASTLRLKPGYSLKKFGTSTNCQAFYLPWEQGLEMTRSVVLGCKLRCNSANNVITTLIATVGTLR